MAEMKKSWADEVDEDPDFMPVYVPKCSAKPAPASPTAIHRPASAPNVLKKSNEGGQQRKKTPSPQPNSPHYKSAPNSPLHNRTQALRDSNTVATESTNKITWRSTTPEPAPNTTPELFERAIFLLGTQRYTDTTLHQHLEHNSVGVVAVAIMRNHHNRTDKPLALGILKKKEHLDHLVTRKVTIYNELIPDRDTIDFRTVEPWEPRKDQDPNTIHIKGLKPDIDAVRTFLAPLGEPRSIDIITSKKVAFVRYDNSLAPYLAVEMFDGRNVAGHPVQVELARKQ